jgi:hydrogenase maturation factor
MSLRTRACQPQINACLAIPGQTVQFCDPKRPFAQVDVAGVRRVVNVALVSIGFDGV